MTLTHGVFEVANLESEVGFLENSTFGWKMTKNWHIVE